MHKFLVIEKPRKLKAPKLPFHEQVARMCREHADTVNVFTQVGGSIKVREMEVGIDLVQGRVHVCGGPGVVIRSTSRVKDVERALLEVLAVARQIDHPDWGYFCHAPQGVFQTTLLYQVFRALTMALGDDASLVRLDKYDAHKMVVYDLPGAPAEANLRLHCRPDPLGQHFYEANLMLERVEFDSGPMPMYDFVDVYQDFLRILRFARVVDVECAELFAQIDAYNEELRGRSNAPALFGWRHDVRGIEVGAAARYAEELIEQHRRRGGG